MNDKIDCIEEKTKFLGKNDLDPSSRRFFDALASVMSRSDVMTDIIRSILDTRPNVTEEHLAWLIFASLQYTSNFAYDRLVYHDNSSLESAILQDLKTHKNDIIELCRTKYMCTNVINRYVALQIVLGLTYRNSPVKVIDIGCSIGLGPLSLNTEHVRQCPVDITDKLLQKALHTNIDLQNNVGVDIQDPDLDWLYACYTPQYKSHRDRVRTLYQNLNNQGQAFTFVRCDVLRLLEATPLADTKFDVAWISNMCYQVEGNPDDAEQAIRSLLKAGGIWLYAYYRNEQPGRASTPSAEPNPYVIGLYPEGTRAGYLEVLEADNDEVKLLRRGKDFDQFYRSFTR